MPSGEYQDLKETRLSEFQKGNFEKLLTALEQENIVLSHHERFEDLCIYAELAKKIIANDSQVLFLFPESTLAAKKALQLRKVFGDILTTYHTDTNQNDRNLSWFGVKEGSYKLVVGTSKSIFLPFRDLALVVVFEEQMRGYKQMSYPHYHARDMALVLANIHHAKVVLSSSTPSVESYYLAMQNKYALVCLPESQKKAIVEYEPVDLQKAYKNNKMHRSFSLQTLDKIRLYLERGKQIIILQNRRGYAPNVVCEGCGHLAYCPNCNASLVYHKVEHTLTCHHCQYTVSFSKRCRMCGEAKVKIEGLGTQKIEEMLQEVFSEAKIQRLDADTTNSSARKIKIIKNFNEKKIDILVATQIIDLHLDSLKTDLVVIASLESLLSAPNFKAFEQAFQLIHKLISSIEQGHMLIQTFQIEHPFLKHILNHDYISFFQEEIEDRKNNAYPPYFRMIRIVLRSPKVDLCENLANEIAKVLQQNGIPASEMQVPSVDKIKNYYIRHVSVKVPRTERHLSAIKQNCHYLARKAMSQYVVGNVRMYIDVDST